MKSKFTSFDVACVVSELQKTIQGLRVINVYDINNKSYIIKLGQDVKTMLFVESGSRLHTTTFEWPKQLMPSAFSAKCRRVMKNKRLTSITQVGCDRIVDLQFGSEEFSSHLIIELYDRGNICLCNNQHVITAILRTRQDIKEDVRYAVGHFYPFDVCQSLSAPSTGDLLSSLEDIKPNTQLKRWLNFQLPYSIPLIDHCLRQNKLNSDIKINKEVVKEDFDLIFKSIQSAHELFVTLPNNIEHGLIFYKNVKSSTTDKIMDEFHPFKFEQLKTIEVKEFGSYNEAIDVYFYEQETQKIEIKSVQQEKSAVKKLDNIKKDHEDRIKTLQKVQETSSHKAYLIEVNLNCVEEAINIIQNLIANRLSWEEVDELVQEGKDNNHNAALAIKKVSLDKNKMTMSLLDLYDEESEPVDVDIDLDMGAYCNAKKYYDAVKTSAIKEQKTIQSSTVALKNAEKKTQAAIKDINIVTTIKKARKSMWFEKFLWFMSSERYIIIGGRDAQQNEILVKKYLKKNDIYVHADIHGATSIIIKNKSNEPIPPKTLMETGCFALCHSAAWNNKIVISAYWVYANQVSKTAPTGEYLATGSFMIRGKKNYLPPAQHILGFSVLFKIDDESIEQRRAAVKENSLLGINNNETEPIPDTEDYCEEDHLSSESEEECTVGDKTQDGVDEVDNLFDKYNLQISAIPKREEPTIDSTEFTEFIGAPHKPFYKNRQQQNTKNNQQNVQIDAQQASNKRGKRGQRGKKKRMEKYADQSDDEREAMMALLGSAGTKKNKTKSHSSNSKLKYKAVSNAKNVVSGFIEEGDSKVKPNEAERVEMTLGNKDEKDPTGMKSKFDNTSIKQPVTETTSSDPCVETSAAKTESKTLNNVGDNKPVTSQDIDLSDTEDEPIDFLDSLILNPTSSDIILFGIPFVAPYSAMTSCKYRVKLTPGATKKGKACKHILDVFSRDKNALLQEKNIFKSLRDVDMTVNIPGKVKISAPNLHSKR